MGKVDELCEKAAQLPESTAAEVLDFLDFLTAQSKQKRDGKKISGHTSVRGLFRGRLSSTNDFAAAKAVEIELEQQ